MQELVHLALGQLLECMAETVVVVVVAAAAAADIAVDTAHPGKNCYYAAVGTIELDHNETVKKSGVVLWKDYSSYPGYERKYQVCDSVNSNGNCYNT